MIWIIGSKGQTGSEVARILTENKINWIGSDKELDISDPRALDTFVLSHDSEAGRTGNAVSRGKVPEKIKWVINCLEYQDFSETDESKALSDKFNIHGPTNIARITRQLGAKLIHISSGYVYAGDRQQPYTEESEVKPLSYYGQSKAKGEDAIQKEMNQYYILRTSWLYGFESNNFIYNLTNKIAYASSTGVLNDRFGMPVSTSDLAEVVYKIIKQSDKATSLFGKNAAIPYGVYNFASNESVSLYDVAGKLYDYSKLHGKISNDCDISPIYGQDETMKIYIPDYMNLNCKKIIEKLKIKRPNWKNSLDKFTKNKNFITGKF